MTKRGTKKTMAERNRAACEGDSPPRFVLTFWQISSYSWAMRRESGVLIPIETSILEAGVRRRVGASSTVSSFQRRCATATLRDG